MVPLGGMEDTALELFHSWKLDNTGLGKPTNSRQEHVGRLGELLLGSYIQERDIPHLALVGPPGAEAFRVELNVRS